MSHRHNFVQYFLYLYCAHIPCPLARLLGEDPLGWGCWPSCFFCLPPPALGFSNRSGRWWTLRAPGLLAWLRPAKPPEPARALTRAERPLGSPLAFLLTTPAGVTSSSVGDFVRGGTMPTAGRQSGQWASWTEEGGETGQGCFLERLSLRSHLPTSRGEDRPAGGVGAVGGWGGRALRGYE